MGLLSNSFKRSGIFKEEFDKIFPDQTFSKVNILKYITACTRIILAEAQAKYPEKKLRFINPLFVVDRELFPAGNLSGDKDVLKFTDPVFSLVQSETIIPLSLPVIDNLLSGICLFYGQGPMSYDYRLFKTFNLDILPGLETKAGTPDEIEIVAEMKLLKIQVSKYPASFLEFASALGAITEDARITLVKTLILYRSMSASIHPSLVFSFVNKYHPVKSFFDCMLTLVSEQAFDEEELLDFAHITESISMPIATYDYSKSKGISAHTMAKRNSLKNVLVDTFKVGIN